MTNAERIIEVLSGAASGYWDMIRSTLQPTGGEIPKEVFPIPLGKKQWVHVNFHPFHQRQNEDRLVAVIIGARSDGRTFHSEVWIPLNISPADALRMADMEIPVAIQALQSYRDCICGITGMTKTGKKDEDGEYIAEPVFSICPKHPTNGETKCLQ